MKFFIPLPRFRDRDGRGVEKDEDTRPTLKYFFKLFKRKFSNLLSLNILMLLMVIPIAVAVYAYFTTDMTPSQTSLAFAPVYGISLIEPSLQTANLLALFGIPLNIPIYEPVAYWIIGGCAVFLILTQGWQMVGSTYVLRGLVRGDAVFVFSDYFYGIKRNFKEGFLFGLLDALLLGVLGVDLLFYYGRIGSFGNDAMFWGLSAVLILYLLMRPYIYMMLITFKMKLRKIFKNALIFSILGIKRNLMGALGIVLLVVLHGFLILVLPTSILSIGLILPVLYLIAAIGFIIAYAIYPVIDRWMIAPVTPSDGENEDGTDSEEVTAE